MSRFRYRMCRPGEVRDRVSDEAKEKETYLAQYLV